VEWEDAMGSRSEGWLHRMEVVAAVVVVGAVLVVLGWRWLFGG
jgi:hypothetical protein